jgi:DNA-binding MarR family transcriptional regulator
MKGKAENYGQIYLIKLHRLVDRMDKLADQLLQKELGLSYSQFQVLAILRQHPAFKQSDIAHEMGVTAAVISRQIMALQEKRLVKQEQNAVNRRQSYLTLTEEGAKLVKKGSEMIYPRLIKPFRVLSDDDQQTMLAWTDSLLSEFEQL